MRSASGSSRRTRATLKRLRPRGCARGTGWRRLPSARASKELLDVCGAFFLAHMVGLIPPVDAFLLEGGRIRWLCCACLCQTWETNTSTVWYLHKYNICIHLTVCTRSNEHSLIALQKLMHHSLCNMLCHIGVIRFHKKLDGNASHEALDRAFSFEEFVAQ